MDRICTPLLVLCYPPRVVQHQYLRVGRIQDAKHPPTSTSAWPLGGRVPSTIDMRVFSKGTSASEGTFWTYPSLWEAVVDDMVVGVGLEEVVSGRSWCVCW
jgi:hypothetical protein